MEKFNKELKLTIIHLNLMEKRSFSSLSKEYGVTATTISKWVKTYCDELQSVLEIKNAKDNSLKIQNLLKQIEELETKKFALIKNYINHCR